jgi:hypothetical protein
MGNTAVTVAEPDGVCAFCGQTAELRPYGPKGERICFTCATKDEKAKACTERQVKRVLFGGEVN